MRISDWSSDVCSSDLGFDRDAQYAAGQNVRAIIVRLRVEARGAGHRHHVGADPLGLEPFGDAARNLDLGARGDQHHLPRSLGTTQAIGAARAEHRSEEHTSELQSLMRISYAVLRLKKNNK